MKKITSAILVALLIISICMFYLIGQGISLRSAPIIQPSEISHDQRNVAVSVVQRLFQQFQEAHYIVWGVLPKNENSNELIKLIKEEYFKIFKQSINLIEDAENINSEKILNCQSPCWLFVSDNKAHQLTENSLIEKNILTTGKSFFTMTIVSFKRDQNGPQDCGEQKRLNLNCLISLSIRDVKRKLKDSNKKYFFLRKYNESDFFLFLENY